jgi:hypothetical protein
LIVTAGRGWVQQWGGQVEEIRQGDVVWIPPNQKHWHGAAASTSMTHIAIQENLNGKSVECSAGLQAWIYAGIGDREHTLESLEKDENQRGTTTLFLRDDAKLDFVRTEPRFIALLKKTHLDDN